MTGQAADVVEALHDVLDPDLGVDVVDLGFVYGAEIDADGHATLEMTLTSPACPLTKVIEDQIRIRLVDSGLVTGYAIRWVWSPAWTPERVTPEGREQLRAIGFSL